MKGVARTAGVQLKNLLVSRRLQPRRLKHREKLGKVSKLKKDRSRLEIIMDMLKAIQEENRAKKTRIMQRAYLDWRNFERYLDFLLAQGFIIKSSTDAYYELTVKGTEMLRRLKEVDEMIS